MSYNVPAMSPLPAPSAEAAAHSARLTALIAAEITQQGGWIDFARFMELALYAPGLGYYAAGAQKFGSAGDFVTAPEMTALFGQALAAQVAQIQALSAPQVLEVGAGSGRLAADLLQALEILDALPVRYRILELSADLRQRQQETLAQAVPHLLPRVEWLDCLPDAFAGAIVANELLDAMPVHQVAWREDRIVERGVAIETNGSFCWQERPATGDVLSAATELGSKYSLPPGYESEIALAAPRWTAEWGRILTCGALLLIDYGFPQREYYHPQRGRGTLMCHYRHMAHTDPFYLPGLQDITAHVDFTAIIAAAHPTGLTLLGYASQASFLNNCGILDCLTRLEPGSSPYLRAAGAVNKLLLPHEMGELFKVIALGRGIAAPLLGFRRGDQSCRL